jgi:membrane associated rhomboid family serine protease/ribosomal protein L37AE/L43A
MPGTDRPVTAAAHPSQSEAYLCPSCGHVLDERRSDTHGIIWICPACGGRAVGVGMLKQLKDPNAVTQMWLAAETALPGHDRRCPACGAGMRSVTARGLPTVDVCTLCELFWFDPTAYDGFPGGAATVQWEPLPGGARPADAPTILANGPSQAAAAQARRSSGDGPPEEWWKYLAALFGMPVRDGEEQLDRPPWTTWGLVAFTSAVSVVAMTNLNHWIALYGFIPAQAQRDGGLTFLTSFFLHAGVFHLVSNMYFLLLFGDNVEETIGVPRYLLLVFTSAVVGTAVHGTFDPHRAVPLVGASGGIAGIMAFYALQFPGIRLKFVIGSLWLGVYRWITVPAWGFFVFWITMQGFGVAAQVAGLSNVSSLGHMGGAAIGALFYLEWRFVSRDSVASEGAEAPVSGR